MLGCSVVVALASGQLAADPVATDSVATLGGGADRNMAATATGLPTRWDLASGDQVAWRAALGTETYTSPVVAGGKVFVGTNNGDPRDPAVQGDHGVLMAFRAADGQFLWQRTHAKLASGAINDWPEQGVCTTPTVAGDRLYYVSNRGELLSLDTANGRTVWSLDMVGALGAHPHHMSVSSPLVVGDRVFVHTSHGVDAEGKVPRPEVPSFLAVDRKTGKILWRDASPGAGILDGQWSSPSFGRLAGRPQVLFPGGDGWLYAFDPATGKRLWRFDASSHLAVDLDRPRENLIGPAAIAVDTVFIAVGHDPELGSGRGQLWALDGSGDGDLGAVGKHLRWSFQADDFSRTLGTVAVADGLLYITDLNGFLHCLDAATGERLWSHDTFAAVWASPVVADGKVYVADADGDLAVLRAGREESLLFEVNMGNAIYAPPTVVDGRLYVATRSALFAIDAVGVEPAAAKKETSP